MSKSREEMISSLKREIRKLSIQLDVEDDKKKLARIRGRKKDREALLNAIEGRSEKAGIETATIKNPYDD